MKKIIQTIIIFSLLILAFNACSDSATGTEPAPDPDPEPSGAVELSGSIDQDKVLEDIFDDPAKADYLVTGDLTTNAKLTIKPGVVLQVKEDVQIKVSNSGALIAEGTAQDSVTFTTVNKAAGILWKGLLISSSTALNSLKYVNLSYAGNSDIDFRGDNYSTGIGITNGGKLKIENSHIHHNGGYGIYLDESEGTLSSFINNQVTDNTLSGMSLKAAQVAAVASNNTFLNNNIAAVEIVGSTLGAKQNVTWHKLGGTSAYYYVSGNLVIDGKLSVEPGVEFKMGEDVLFKVNSSGALTVEGTASDMVTFTTANEAAGILWKGLLVSSSSSLNLLKFVNVSYAGNSDIDFRGDNYSTGIGIANGGKLKIENSHIHHNGGYGIYLDESEGTLSSFIDNQVTDNTLSGMSLKAAQVAAVASNNTFLNNNIAAVEIVGSTLGAKQNVTWHKLGGTSAYYYVSGNLGIDGKLSVEPGVEFKMGEDVLFKVNSSGALTAEGTASDMVTFTTANKTAGLHWKGIFILSSTGNILNYCNVSYAGNSDMNFRGDNFSTNIGVDSNGELTLTNSTITNSKGFGVWSQGTINSFELAGANNTFNNNPQGNHKE